MKALKIIAAILLVCMFATFFVACDGVGGIGSADRDGGANGGNKGNGDNEAGPYVEYKGVKIELGANADDVIAALGEPQSKTEIGDCGGLGAQIRYVYGSIDIYVLQSKTDGNVIDQIAFRDDLVSTPEGVYIGMEADEAKAKLGTPTKETEKAIQYTSGKYTLKLDLSEGKITDINYIMSSN